MNETIKAEWITRLRSGNIPQATGCLGRDDGSRCCLGVLCDIAVEQGIIPAPTFEKAATIPDTYIASYGTNLSVLPEKVADWAELPHDEDALHVSPEVDGRSLAGLNDGGHTFREIADLIDANL